jgi:biopolymer transport protein ExbB/TolQ
MGRLGYGGVILGAWFVLAVLGTVVAAWLGRRIWKRRKATSLLMSLVGSMTAASLMLGAVGTLLGLTKAFAAVGSESEDPSQKARILAEGISEAMNCTALALAVGVSIAIFVAMARFIKRSN